MVANQMIHCYGFISFFRNLQPLEIQIISPNTVKYSRMLGNWENICCQSLIFLHPPLIPDYM